MRVTWISIVSVSIAFLMPRALQKYWRNLQTELAEFVRLHGADNCEILYIKYKMYINIHHFLRIKDMRNINLKYIFPF